MSQSAEQLKEQLSGASLTPHAWGVRRAGRPEERQRAADANDVKTLDWYGTSKKVINTKMLEWKAVTQIINYADWWWDCNTFPYLDGQRLFHKDRRAELWAEVDRLDKELRVRAGKLDAKRDEILAEAKDVLGKAFDESVYPAKWAAVFSLEVREHNIDPPQYLKRDDAEEYKKELARRLGDIDAGMRQFERECFARMGQVASSMAHNLGGESNQGLGTNVKGFKELFDRVGQMRFEGTAAFKKCVSEAKKIIDGVDADEIKKPGGVRKDVREKIEGLIARHKQLQEAIKKKGAGE